MRRTMDPRTRRLAFGAGLLLIALAGVSPSSAASLGGLVTDDLGAVTATTRVLTGATLEWNPGVLGRDALDVGVVRLTADAGESFAAGDEVEATVGDGQGRTCTTAAVVASAQQGVDLGFPACALSVVDLRRIALAVTGSGATSVLSGDLGGLSGTLSGLVGGVVDPSDRLAAGIESSLLGGVDTMRQLYLDVHDATVDELLGRRLIISLYGPQAGAPPTHVYSGVVGAVDDNEGVWAEVDPEATGIDLFPTVIADIRTIEPDGGWPAVSAISRYELVLLQTQHLVAPERQPDARAYAARALGGVIDHDIPADDGPADGTQPVDLDSRLIFSEPGGAVTPTNSLSFCQNFRVTNTSDEIIERWTVTFDTTKPPLWGIDPRIIDPNTSGGALTSEVWGAHTESFDEATGRWTLVGADYNQRLEPGRSADAGYCARASIPAPDPTTFDTPQISIVGDNENYVELRVRVTSTSRWYVPWEVEIDLADYICADTLPPTFTGQNATLTRISGTRYLLRGSVTADTRFVSATSPRDFVFLGYNPLGHPARPPGCS